MGGATAVNLKALPKLILTSSHPVVVDQLIGLHFVLRPDGPLGLDLHPAVVTSVEAQTLTDSDEMMTRQQ